MKYTIVFFSTVGQCPWWCFDTDECGLSDTNRRCTGQHCDVAPSMEPPSHCPTRDVPNSDNWVEKQNDLTTGNNTAEPLPEGEITPTFCPFKKCDHLKEYGHCFGSCPHYKSA
jgi:hypothetical protein